MARGTSQGRGWSRKHAEPSGRPLSHGASGRPLGSRLPVAIIVVDDVDAIVVSVPLGVRGVAYFGISHEGGRN